MNSRLNRRHLLSMGTKTGLLGALSSLGLLGYSSAHAAVSDYKALVCLNLLGGNDGNNMIVPMDTVHYSAYTRVRGGLALSTGAKTLLAARQATLRSVDNPVNQPFAFHYGMPEIDALFGQGKVAAMLNCGNLSRPLTKAQYLANTGVPPQLFSHPDQSMQAQTGTPAGAASGWGGRLVDAAVGAGGVLDAVAVDVGGMFIQGAATLGNVIPNSGTMGLPGMDLWPASAGEARKAAMLSIAGSETGNVLGNAANRAVLNAFNLSAALKTAKSGAVVRTTFPGTDMGKQLQLIAQLIASRAGQGPGRQVYMASLGGFDTHGGQTYQQFAQLQQVSQAVGAFQSALLDAGVDQRVTSFTLSDFGRDFQPSGDGTDHAWGSHHLVIGGAVSGGLYGQFPEFTLGGPDDATGRGSWIPQIGMQQIGATLGRWFGVSDSALASQVFKNELANFPRQNLGFMG